MSQCLERTQAQMLHEAMMALGMGAIPLHTFKDSLRAEVALLDELRSILAGAVMLDGHALIPRDCLENAKAILESTIGAKSIALDLLSEQTR